MERPFARAGAALTAWMDARAITNENLAEACGTGRTAVSKWRHGLERPNTVITMLLEHLTAAQGGPRASWWLTPGELEQAKKRAARIAALAERHALPPEPTEAP